MVNVRPAIVTVPVRDALAGFLGTVKLTLAEPLPEGVRAVIQEALLTAVQEHPAGAVTDTATVPPLAPKFLLVGLNAYVHPGVPACVTVRTLSPIVSVAEREDVVGFAAAT
jgi:hypothetical protein